MWIATHYIGMIRKAVEISKLYPDTVTFLDFHDHNFDDSVVLRPARVNASFWARNLRTDLADLSHLIAPKRVVLCEGARSDAKSINTEFYARCYQRIFEDEFPETLFISVGSSNDVLTGGAALRGITNRMVKGVEVVSVIDRDERSDNETREISLEGHRVLPVRHLEHYLLADEIITKLCIEEGVPEAVQEVLKEKNRAISKLSARNLPSDDIKRCKGEIFNAIKHALKATKLRFGSNSDIFCRDVMAPRITRDTQTYQELKGAIFGAQY